MEYKQLGKTGERIPVLGIGTWKMGVNPDQEIAALNLAIKKGIKFIDTAEMYRTEDIVGAVLKDNNDVFTATKVSPNHFHYDDVIDSCNNSLKTLGIKQMGLYQLHWPNHSVKISETMKAMEDLVDQGKIRHIGVSNFTVKELKEAQDSMKKYEIASNQVEYSILVREVEGELLDFCRQNKITMIAYSPLARGAIFSQKYSNILNLMAEIGKKHNKTAVQVALNWLISKEPVVAIPKASSREHILEILGAQGWRLTSKEIAELDSLEERKASLAGFFAPVLKSTGIWSHALSKMGRKKDHSKSSTTKSSKK